jgi:N-formylglutamate amidohydrolase
MSPDWLEVRRGEAPLVVGFPHTGTELPAELEGEYPLALARPPRRRLVDRSAV